MRHHIMEIMLEAVVLQALGPSCGSEILIFKRFRTAWPNIDRNKFSTVSSDPNALRCVENVASSTILFAEKQLNDYQPRDDYEELLKLTIIFLGGVGTPTKGYHSELLQVFIVHDGWQRQCIALSFSCFKASLN